MLFEVALRHFFPILKRQNCGLEDALERKAGGESVDFSPSMRLVIKCRREAAELSPEKGEDNLLSPFCAPMVQYFGKTVG